MRIAPRTLLCASAWLAGGSHGRHRLRRTARPSRAAGDKVSLAMGMAGWLPALIVHARFREAIRVGFRTRNLLESIGDPTLTLGLVYLRWPPSSRRGEIDRNSAGWRNG